MTFKQMEEKAEHVIISGFFSSLTTLVMYLAIAIIIWYTDHININEEPVGILAILVLFITTFWLYFILFQGDDNDNRSIK